MMGNKESEDGLFAYWDGADELTSNIWRDRINNLSIRIGTNTTHGDGYYTISKLTSSAPIGYMQIQSDVSPYIDYNFVVKIECDIQAVSDYAAYVLSYGSLRRTDWSYAFSAGITKDGVVSCSVKNSGNGLLAHDVDGTLASWNASGWNNGVIVKTGVYLKPNDKQRGFTSVNGVLTETVDLTKVLLRPTRYNGTTCFGLIGYGEAGAYYITNCRYFLRIRTIKMYNKKI